MPRGRPKGSVGDPQKAVSAELSRRVEESPAGALDERLTAVADDAGICSAVRLEALRRLFALFASRMIRERAAAIQDSIPT